MTRVDKCEHKRHCACELWAEVEVELEDGAMSVRATAPPEVRMSEPVEEAGKATHTHL